MDDEYYEEHMFDGVWKWILLLGIIFLVISACIYIHDKQIFFASLVIGAGLSLASIQAYFDDVHEREDNKISLKPRLFQVKDICGPQHRYDRRYATRIRTYDGGCFWLNHDIHVENGKNYKGMLKTYPKSRMEPIIVRVEEI